MAEEFTQRFSIFHFIFFCIKSPDTNSHEISFSFPLFTNPDTRRADPAEDERHVILGHVSADKAICRQACRYRRLRGLKRSSLRRWWSPFIMRPYHFIWTLSLGWSGVVLHIYTGTARRQAAGTIVSSPGTCCRHDSWFSLSSGRMLARLAAISTSPADMSSSEFSMGSHFGVKGGRGIGSREVLEGSAAGEEVFGNGRKKFQ